MKPSPRFLVLSGLVAMALAIFAAAAMAQFSAEPVLVATADHDHSTHNHDAHADAQTTPDHGSSAAPYVAAAKGHTHPPQAESDKAAKAKALLTQGYVSVDVYTALNLEKRTGIEAISFLLVRQQGLEWPQVIEQVAPGISLPREGQKSAEPVQIEESVISQYQDQGFSRKDVVEAAELARDHELPLAEVMALKSPDRTWPQVEVELILRASRPAADGRLDLAFGEEGRPTTESGMTKEEVYRLMDQGYALEDVLLADQLAMQVEATPQEILVRVATGEDWEAIRQALPMKPVTLTDEDVIQTTGLDAGTVASLRAQGLSPKDLLMANHFAEERGSSLDSVLDEFKQNGRDWKNVKTKGPSAADVARTINMSLDEVEALIAQGATPMELIKANDKARKEGKSLADALAEVKNGKHERVMQVEQLTKVLSNGEVEVTDRSRSGMTLDEVNRLLQQFEWSEIDTADIWAERLGTSAEKLLKARRKGLEWDQVVAEFYAEEHGSSLADLAKALEVPAELANDLTVTAEERSQLTAMGLDADGAARAWLIAKATDRPILEVAALKTPEISWLDVAKLVKKGGKK